MHSQAKDLFQMQAQLVDVKVDMAVNNAIERVVQQIHDLRHEMRDRFVSLENRMIAVETRLGISQETKTQIKTKFIEYVFKAISAISAVGFAYFLLQFQVLVK
jgi:hypothetical protein